MLIDEDKFNELFVTKKFISLRGFSSTTFSKNIALEYAFGMWSEDCE